MANPENDFTDHVVLITGAARGRGDPRSRRHAFANSERQYLAVG